MMLKDYLRNTPGTAGGLGGRDRTLSVKSRKTARKSAFFRKKIKKPLPNCPVCASQKMSKKKTPNFMQSNDVITASEVEINDQNQYELS